MNTAADLLKTKHKKDNFIAKDATLQQAAQLMFTINCPYLVVMDGGDLKGLFTEHDYLRLVAYRGWDPSIIKVQEAMTRDLPCVEMEDDVKEVLKTMVAHHTHYVPVFHGHQFEGVISTDTIINGFMEPELKSDYQQDTYVLDYDQVMKH